MQLHHKHSKYYISIFIMITRSYNRIWTFYLRYDKNVRVIACVALYSMKVDDKAIYTKKVAA